MSDPYIGDVPSNANHLKVSVAVDTAAKKNGSQIGPGIALAVRS